tara:strand:- start:396 stop:590 length:195 start_codon:yes stop_codon:yes gene_type:complete
MTRQHFITIAATFKVNVACARHLAEQERNAALDALSQTATDLAAEFARINPRFDRSRFLLACGF